MARRIGSVLGKTVVVQGQGQNGLIATRLMSQMGAKHIIAVEPLPYRRALALQFGAHEAMPPEDAMQAIQAATADRGAELVLEMVGHNQDTVNAALDYVARAGMVCCFGVPDEAVYEFHFSKFFRKNVCLLSSVIPDPGVDFPEAVRMVETGQFDTDGLFTHTLPLREIEKAFTVASNYEEGVVKLVIAFGEPD